jgi:tetratricopeptide (TPR) repeat protein
MLKPMPAPARNAPCPCGSGTKYKKCCLLRSTPEASPPAWPPPGATAWVDDGLDALSNSVLTLIRARRFEDALGACQRLLQEFPDVVDGLERSALVHTALGDHATAADFYRQALAFVTHPSRCHDYDDADFYRQQLAQQEQLARPR